MMFIDKSPHWLRWLLFLPSTVLAYAIAQVVYLLLRIINEIAAPSYLEWAADMFAIVVASGLIGFMTVWVGARVAPRYQLFVAISIAIVVSAMNVLPITWKLAGMASLQNSGWFEISANFIAGAIGAVIACYDIYEKTGRDTAIEEDL